MRNLLKICPVVLILMSHFNATEVYVWSRVLLWTSVIALLGIVLYQLFVKRQVWEFTALDLLVMGFTFFIWLTNIIKGTFEGNLRLLELLLALLLYILFKQLFKVDHGVYLKYLIIGLVAGSAIELTIGLSQIFGLHSNSDTKFILGGLFGNPAALAGFLSAMIPLFLGILLYQSDLFTSRHLHFLIVLCFLLSICLILLSESRAAWISSFIGALVILNKRYQWGKMLIRSQKRVYIKFSIIGLTFILTSFILYGLYNFKRESAIGRVFIWKTSVAMLKTNTLSGRGFGSFENSYGKFQSEYFAKGWGSQEEKQVADYVTCAYNEFLEITIESGVVGLMLFISIFFFAYSTGYTDNTSYAVIAQTVLLSILILACVAYPFRLLPILFLFTICLAILSVSQSSIFTLQVKYSKCFGVFTFLLFSIILYYDGVYTYGIYYFKLGYSKVLSGNIESGINDYEKAIHALNHNPEFMYYYGSALFLKRDYQECIRVLEKVVTKRSDPNAFILLGNCYEITSRYASAEKVYLEVSNMIPSRLHPRYLLAKLYIKTNQTQKSIEIANEIIAGKEKVTSMATIQMKEEMVDLINEVKQNK